MTEESPSVLGILRHCVPQDDKEGDGFLAMLGMTPHPSKIKDFCHLFVEVCLPPASIEILDSLRGAPLLKEKALGDGFFDSAALRSE